MAMGLKRFTLLLSAALHFPALHFPFLLLRQLSRTALPHREARPRYDPARPTTPPAQCHSARAMRCTKRIHQELIIFQHKLQPSVQPEASWRTRLLLWERAAAAPREGRKGQRPPGRESPGFRCRFKLLRVNNEGGPHLLLNIRDFN